MAQSSCSRGDILHTVFHVAHISRNWKQLSPTNLRVFCSFGAASFSAKTQEHKDAISIVFLQYGSHFFWVEIWNDAWQHFPPKVVKPNENGPQLRDPPTNCNQHHPISLYQAPMASESESSAESEGGREVEAPTACGSGCFLPLLEEDTWLQVRRRGQKSSCLFFFVGGFGKKYFHGTIVFGGWWCVCLYILYNICDGFGCLWQPWPLWVCEPHDRP